MKGLHHDPTQFSFAIWSVAGQAVSQSVQPVATFRRKSDH